jgi:hypothetical protein
MVVLLDLESPFASFNLLICFFILGFKTCQLYLIVGKDCSSVSDQYSLNSDPDPGILLNPDPDPAFCLIRIKSGSVSRPRFSMAEFVKKLIIDKFFDRKL